MDDRDIQEAGMQGRRTHAVIVGYHPPLDNVRALCRLLRDNGVSICIVDNSRQSTLDDVAREYGALLLHDGRNTGIGAGQNAGIRASLAQGAEEIVLLDQDSRLDPGYFRNLALLRRQHPVAVLAPVYTDAATGFVFPVVRVDGMGRKCPVQFRDGTAAADVVIASGMCIPAAVLQTVGLMDESLFIDGVDTDWCFRCRHERIQIRVSPLLRMQHSIGNGVRRLGFVTLLVHNPVRTYYKTRNAWLLLRRGYIPFSFRVREVAAALVHGALAGMMARPHCQHCVRFTSGVIDGILGRVGPIEN